MPGPKLQDLYNPVATVNPETATPNDYQNIHASADSFGAQVGQAEERLGATGEKTGDQAIQLATKYAQQATEAKANDLIVNQWAPQASQLRANFDQLRGQDKVQGYDGYIANLQNSRQQFLDNATSPYEKEILNTYITRHIAQEVDGARREMVSAQNQFEDEAHLGRIQVDADNAVRNYNNPDAVASSFSTIDGQIQKHGMDRGQPQEQIDQTKRDTRGYVVTGMVGHAVSGGDVATAGSLYEKNKELIPGDQQLQIEKTLHAEATRQNGYNGANALAAGQPLPQGVGTAPYQVRSVVADTAKSSGVDQNSALTVLRIESSDGQNLGSRGTIGQTSGKGGTIQEQAQDMCNILKKSNDIATNTLGRPAQPWEAYAVYQQGPAGGPALFKAAQDNPTMKAVDALKPFYSNPKDALAAVQNNGGNATMTSGQFLNFIQQKYTDTAQRANCTPPGFVGPMPQDPAQQPALGPAITAPHEAVGTPVQNGATPVTALQHFNDVYPEMVSRIQQIPNDEEREGVFRALERKRTMYETSATAWRQNLQLEAGKLGTNPDFKSMDQVPADMKAALSDNPQTFSYLERMAQYNSEHGSGMATKDSREYGSGFFDVFKAVHAPEGTPGRITDVADLQRHLTDTKDITVAGYDKLVTEMSGKKSPEGDAEGMMKKQFYANAKAQISGADEGLHLKDPKGDELFLRFMAQSLPMYEKGRAEGKSATELLNPDSPDYIGKSISTFKRPMSQWVSDMSTSGETVRTPLDVAREARTTTDPKKKEALKQELIQMGVIRPDGPQVPRPE